MKNSKIFGGVVFGIGLFVYILLALLIPFQHTESFWISFICTIFVFMVAGIFSYLAVNTKRGTEKLFGMSLLWSSGIYILVQVVLSLLFMAIAVVPVWLDVLVMVLVLAVYLILAFGALFVKGKTVEQEGDVKKKTVALRYQSARLSSLQNRVSDQELKGELGKVYDALKYSDPMGNDSTEFLEQDIMSHITSLEQEIASEQYDKVTELCGKLMNLIQERNQLCKLHKS